MPARIAGVYFANTGIGMRTGGVIVMHIAIHIWICRELIDYDPLYQSQRDFLKRVMERTVEARLWTRLPIRPHRLNSGLTYVALISARIVPIGST